VLAQQRIQERLKHLNDSPLDHPIDGRRDGQLPGAAAGGLGYQDCPVNGRSVGVGLDCLADGSDQLPDLGVVQVFEMKAVNTWGVAVTGGKIVPGQTEVTRIGYPR
jgi:hypothetical protein